MVMDLVFQIYQIQSVQTFEFSKVTSYLSKPHNNRQAVRTRYRSKHNIMYEHIGS